MKKDKRSKAKDKSNNDQVPVSPGIFSTLRDSKIYPFKKYSDQINPFTNPMSKFNTHEKALVYQLVIGSIVEFASECTDYMQWDFGDKIDIKKKIPDLNKQIKEITNQLIFLIPAIANRTKKTSVLRMYEAKPEVLVYYIESLKLKLEHYDQSEKLLKIKGSRKTEKNKSIKNFWINTFKRQYPKTRFEDTRTYTNIALSFLACLTSCSFYALKKIYQETPKKARNEIYDNISLLFSIKASLQNIS